MRTLNKNFITLILFISGALILMTALFPHFAAAASPELIKIGLFYGQSAKDSYQLSSTGGMAVFLADDKSAVRLATDNSVSAVTVKKNIYYSTETSAVYFSAEEALAAANTLRNEGKDAYCAVSGGNYTVRIGTYQSYEEAQSYAALLGTYPVWNTATGVLILQGNNIWLAVDDVSRFPEIVSVSGNLSLNSKAYRGSFRFLRQSGNDMAAINILPIDEYLYSVVPKEVSPSWHEEALKAQAVVARTYALTNLNKFSGYGFNLDDTTASQVYGGISAEHPRTTAAVNATKRETVLYEGTPASVYYSSSTGGRTANSEDVWGNEVPYLKSVSDEYQNPAEATYASWEKTYTKSELKDMLNNRGVNIGDITDVRAETTSYGYVTKLIFSGNAGTKTYTKDNIRVIPGIYSTCFTVIKDGGNPVSLITSNGIFSVSRIDNLSALSYSGSSTLNSVVSLISKDGIAQLADNADAAFNTVTFSGGGWGHGVGMSQWGAKGMADNGFTYTDIIKHYFSGVQVEKY